MASSAKPRLLLRRLRQVLSESGGAQERLNHIVSVIAANMVAEVCSVYLIRAGKLELFATEGLNQSAVHKTRLAVGEGLVGIVAEHARPLAISEARRHPNFAYRPETGEEIYHSLMGVPILRGGRVVGVLVVQNRTARDYSDDELEVMQTVAMVLAEMIEALLGRAGAAAQVDDGAPRRLVGTTINEGLGRGVAVMHRPRVIVEHHVADDPQEELNRLDQALTDTRDQIDGLLQVSESDGVPEPREILETYRMFASDKGWIRRMREAVHEGLTAEAAVERVQVDNQVRMSDIKDPYLRERMHDFADLSNRLLRHLTGVADSAAQQDLPAQTVLVARNMGPAELLEYDRSKVTALLLEEGSQTAHVAIVARALSIPVIGRLRRLLDLVDDGDVMAVDAEHGQVFVRPNEDVLHAFTQSLKQREQRLARFDALRDDPAVTLDGVKIALNINAGLLVDLPNLDATGADGIGLYRTELQFMVRATLPKAAQQIEMYRRVLDAAGEKPVVFRTLDVGGDKILSYLARQDDEENPAMGWRAMRLSLDRPGLLRIQMRALLSAAQGGPLKIMFPMIAEVAELVAARKLLQRECQRLCTLGGVMPAPLQVGVMLEVPSLAWQLPALLPLVDFVSIGSNDLMQFLFAADRGNPRLAHRYDVLSPAAMSFLHNLVTQCKNAGVPVALCGEAAGHPLEAMALVGLGLRDISMNAAAIGPVKMMLRSLDVAKLQAYMEPMFARPDHSLRAAFREFADREGVVIEAAQTAGG